MDISDNMIRSKYGGLARGLVLACVLVTSGCASIGPAVIARDRFDYNGEVARSWKEQILLNIVKTRYLDMPVFLDISQIVSGYTVQGALTVGGSTDAGFASSAQGSYSDRPTITYTPLTGAQFNRNMLTPIPPSTILFAMTSGWRSDLLFRMAVASINGVESTGPDAARYDRVLMLMTKLQEAGAIGMRVSPGKPDQSNTLLVFQAGTITPELEAMRKELREILGIPQGQSEFSVVYGQSASRPGEIAMQTRGMMQILINYGAFVDVPEADVVAGRTTPSRPIADAGAGALHIKFSHERPNNAIARVAYREGWYWIDDSDLESKKTFALIMLLSTLAETGGRESLPLVTIPAG